MNFTDFTEKYNIQLNEQQLRAVRAVDGPVLLLAVPGSGKTTVLVSRLGYMIYCLGIRPESILTVTYTVAATEDMRRRFAKIFGEEDAKRLEFRTINGISQKEEFDYKEYNQYCSILHTGRRRHHFRWQIKKLPPRLSSPFWK